MPYDNTKNEKKRSQDQENDHVTERERPESGNRMEELDDVARSKPAKMRKAMTNATDNETAKEGKSMHCASSKTAASSENENNPEEENGNEEAMGNQEEEPQSMTDETESEVGEMDDHQDAYVKPKVDNATKRGRRNGRFEPDDDDDEAHEGTKDLDPINPIVEVPPSLSAAKGAESAGENKTKEQRQQCKVGLNECLQLATETKPSNNTNMGHEGTTAASVITSEEQPVPEENTINNTDSQAYQDQSLIFRQLLQDVVEEAKKRKRRSIQETIKNLQQQLEPDPHNEVLSPISVCVPGNSPETSQASDTDAQASGGADAEIAENQKREFAEQSWKENGYSEEVIKQAVEEHYDKKGHYNYTAKDLGEFILKDEQKHQYDSADVQAQDDQRSLTDTNNKPYSQHGATGFSGNLCQAYISSITDNGHPTDGASSHTVNVEVCIPRRRSRCNCKDQPRINFDIRYI